jgi:hypothetical protein
MELQHPPAEYNNMDGNETHPTRRRTPIPAHRSTAALLITSFVALGLSIASLSISYFATTKTAVDPRLTVAQRVSGYFNNLDLRQWNLTLDFFEDTYFSDYNIEGATPMTLNRAHNWLVWPCFLDGFNTTHHQIGNIVVDFGRVDPATDGAVANITLKGTATHNYNGQLWQTAGIYNMCLRRHGKGPFRLLHQVQATLDDGQRNHTQPIGDYRGVGEEQCVLCRAWRYQANSYTHHAHDTPVAIRKHWRAFLIFRIFSIYKLKY